MVSKQTISKYSQIPLSNLNISKLLAEYDKARNKEIGEAFFNFKSQNFLSQREYDAIKNQEMLNLVKRIIEINRNDQNAWQAGVTAESELFYHNFNRASIQGAYEALSAAAWEECWRFNPKLRADSDEKENFIVDCLLNSLEGLSLESFEARLNLPYLSFPGGYIQQDLAKFKHDILPCFFDSDGNMLLYGDIDAATGLIAEFLRTISRDKEYFDSYLNKVISRKNYVLTELMKKELNNNSEDFFYKPYAHKSNTFCDVARDTLGSIGWGDLGIAERAKNSSLNKDIEKLLDLSVGFAEAHSIVAKYKDVTKRIIKYIFGKTYLQTYTRYGVLKKYKNDSHYKKLTKKELREIRSNQRELDMLNTALWLRSRIGTSIMQKFDIKSSANAATMKIVDKMVDHITKGTADPLDELMKSDDKSNEEVVSSFFDEEGILKSISQEKRLSIIASEAKVPTGSCLPDKIINLFYQLGSKIEDAELRHLIFKYLVRHAEADEILQYNYRKIGVNTFGVCVNLLDGIEDLQRLASLDFIKKYFDDKQIRNHHSLTFLVAEFFEALYDCGKGQGMLLKKYVILSCLDRLSVLMHANNRIENAEKIESQIIGIFKDFNLPAELYDVKKNIEHIKWLSNSLNNFDAKKLEQLIAKYDRK